MKTYLLVLSFVFAALVLIPLVWYFRAANIAALAIGLWLSVTNIIYAVDALIWARDDIKASIWCDISTSFITSSHLALPAACLCICIHLERLASFSQTSTFVAKQRRILLECIICFGLPVLYTVIHLIVQPRRYDLFKGFGCRPATLPSILSIFLVWVPPLILAIATITYAGIAWWHFVAHGVQFARDSGKLSSSSLTCNSYIRLIGMAVLEVVLSMAMTALRMWYTLTPGLVPVEESSRNLGEVLVWDADAMSERVRVLLLVEWAGVVIQSALFFGLFALRMDFIRQAIDQMLASQDTWKWKDGSRGFGGFVNVARIDSNESRQFDLTHTSTSAPVLPIAVLDFTMQAKSSVESQHGHSVETSSPQSTLRPLRPPSLHFVLTDDHADAAELLDPTLLPLESPSSLSTIPSSHNSLDSGFDPLQFDLSPDDWPKPPAMIPDRRSRRASSMGFVSKQEGHTGKFLAVDQALSACPSQLKAATRSSFRKSSLQIPRFSVAYEPEGDRNVRPVVLPD
ncbi:pheromone A receptor-domain-containing protein [Scleroderma citrinum]